MRNCSLTIKARGGGSISCYLVSNRCKTKTTTTPYHNEIRDCECDSIKILIYQFLINNKIASTIKTKIAFFYTNTNYNSKGIAHKSCEISDEFTWREMSIEALLKSAEKYSFYGLFNHFHFFTFLFIQQTPF